jgi:hypothetical protein
MKEQLFKEKYPIHTVEMQKAQMTMTDMASIVEHFKAKIEAHPVATYIGIFDHYTHTVSLEDGSVHSDIIDAKNVLCCFGKELPSPEMLAVRPRAFGIAEKADAFIISFLEAPNPAANEAMIAWTKALEKAER